MSDLQAKLDKIVKAYDIRGLYPEQFDATAAHHLGVAVGQFLLSDDTSVTQVLVGRDMRPSGPELVAAFGEGIRANGLDVIKLGLISTDMLYFASGTMDTPGAVFTASHNPAGYQGIKLCRRGAAPIGWDSGLSAIKDLAVASDRGEFVAAATPGTSSTSDQLANFAVHVRSFVNEASLRPLKVVVDTANGMGGLVAPAVFDDMDFDVQYLYAEADGYPTLDGTFPNHEANPIQPENLVDLQARVLETGADIGLAFDGDADRVFIVDEKAQGISGSLTTAMVAASILEKEQGGLVLHNLICSKAVPEVVAERGGTSERTRVGHSFIKERMKETGAVFAGEHSGHYYFRDNFRADSGLIAAIVILEMMSVSPVPLSEMVAPFDRYAASGEINTRVDDQQAVVERVAAAFPDADIDHLDGMTVDLGDWWFNLRASNTEPLLRLNLEASNAEAVTEHVAHIQALMQG